MALSQEERDLLIEIRANTESLSKHMGEMRDDFSKHLDQDREDFKELHGRIGRIERRQFYFMGAVSAVSGLLGAAGMWLKSQLTGGGT